MFSHKNLLQVLTCEVSKPLSFFVCLGLGCFRPRLKIQRKMIPNSLLLSLPSLKLIWVWRRRKRKLLLFCVQSGSRCRWTHYLNFLGFLHTICINLHLHLYVPLFPWWWDPWNFFMGPNSLWRKKIKLWDTFHLFLGAIKFFPYFIKFNSKSKIPSLFRTFATNHPSFHDQHQHHQGMAPPPPFSSREGKLLSSFSASYFTATTSQLRVHSITTFTTILPHPLPLWGQWELMMGGGNSNNEADCEVPSLSSTSLMLAVDLLLMDWGRISVICKFTCPEEFVGTTQYHVWVE